MPYTDEEKRKQYLREYKLKHREEILERRRQLYLEKHPPKSPDPNRGEKIKQNKAACDARYRAKHKAKLKLKKEEYYQKNKKQINQKQSVRYRTDIQYRLGHGLRNRLNKALRQNRAGSAVRDLGCSLQEFQVFIEGKFTKGMTWENYGKWHLDHIKPLCKFDLSDREQFLKACHYKNYQPLWAKDNLVKNRF